MVSPDLQSVDPAQDRSSGGMGIRSEFIRIKLVWRCGVSEMRFLSLVKQAMNQAQTLIRRLQQPKTERVRRSPMRSIPKLLVGIMLPLVSLSTPTWALTKVPRPELDTLKRAYVVRVVNYNTIIVQVIGEQRLRLVNLIGIAPLPPINPTWTELTGEVPLAVYESGQFLQDTLQQDEIYLELDPLVNPAEAVLPAYIWDGDRLVNQEMLFEGHALLDQEDTQLKYGSVLVEAEETARRQGRGVWTFFGPQPRQLQNRPTAVQPPKQA